MKSWIEMKNIDLEFKKDEKYALRFNEETKRK